MGKIFFEIVMKIKSFGGELCFHGEKHNQDDRHAKYGQMKPFACISRQLGSEFAILNGKYDTYEEQAIESPPISQAQEIKDASPKNEDP